jgi:hypothetical protein
MSTKHGLIIGINHYRYMQPKYQLNGCVNDAKLLKSTLKNKFNFDPANIVTLYDEAATRDAILAAMERLVEKVEKNDIVVFHFSGHGQECRVKTEFSDEGSGTINCIIPHDDNESAPIDPVLAPAGKIWREIREDKINQWLQELAKKTPYTTLIFDACHSGTMTRSSQTTNVRSIPYEARPQVVVEPSFRSMDSFSASVTPTVKPKKKAWLTLSDNYVVVSGCRDTQMSKEVEFLEGDQFFKHGVLTYYLCSALNKAKPGTTYRDVFERVNAGVVSKVNAQNPQIEGAVDREVFGIRDIEPLAFIPIFGVDGNQIILDGGAAHGLRSGSKWDIYPPFSKLASPEKRLGMLKIVQVGAVTSTAQLIQSSNTPPLHARCVEVDVGYVADKLRVYLRPNPAVTRSGIEPLIGSSQLLQLVDSAETADVVGHIINDVSGIPENLTNEQQQHVSLPVWAFFEGRDDLCMPLDAVNKPAVVKTLVENLDKIARFRNVMHLDNSNTSLNVEFNLFERQVDDNLVLANGGNGEFIEGTTPMVLEIKNNEVDRTVFFSLLWISATREISSVYPYQKASEELSPGKTVRIGDGSNKLTASLSNRYFLDIGSESCKVIFSTVQSDFRWLNQDGMRSTQDSSSHSHSNVSAFDSAFSGNSANVTESSPQVTNDWHAITRSFVITRKANS